MRKHNGMRPQDVVILLKIIAKGDNQWQNKDLANELHISQSEVSDSLNRSLLAGLVNHSKKNVQRKSLVEFIEHGLQYVFPVTRGTKMNGTYTAHSHHFMKQYFTTNEDYVWPHSRGIERGYAIEPLFKEVSKAIVNDEKLYLMLALVDVLRVGKTREINVARTALRKIILDES